MKRFITLLLAISLLIPLQAQKNEEKPKRVFSPNIELYGYVRNDFYYNSRMNEEGIDGMFHYFPKPIVLENGNDIYAVPQANMLSISSRLGINIQGNPIFGAQSNGKIEADFAGYGSTSYVLRIRQAYMQLSWDKTNLLIGQTWHPLWGSVTPTSLSLNAGMPFQPFNRSPQLRLNQNFNSSWSMKLAALYQMQYTSSGPIGFSPNYLRNALVPEFFAGIEHKTAKWNNGIGSDFKMIKPDNDNVLHSFTGTVFSQFNHKLLSVKVKATIGQNLSDQLMANGYGKTYDSTTATHGYSNMNIASTWINFVYGKKFQISLFGGYSQNLGSDDALYHDSFRDNKITLYSRGFYFDSQEFIDSMHRGSLSFSYNIPQFSIGIEYNLTGVEYGELQTNGRTANNYFVQNHRIIASVKYLF